MITLKLNSWFYFQENKDVLLHISSAKYTKTPGYYIKQAWEPLKGGENMHLAGTSGSKEQHDGEFLGFSFYLRYPWLGSEETSNLEMPAEAYKKSPNKCPLSLANRLGRGQQDRKLLKNNCSTPAKHHRNKCDPTPTHPHQTRPVWSADFNPCHAELGASTSHPNLLVGVREGQVQSQDFIPLSSREVPPQPW